MNLVVYTIPHDAVPLIVIFDAYIAVAVTVAVGLLAVIVGLIAKK